MGRISDDKGIEYLIRAFRAIDDPKARLLIAGDYQTVAGGSNIARLRAEAGDDTRVRFLGLLRGERVRDFYASIDVFALPSISESFGIVQVEAMMAGVPSATTDLAGSRYPVQATGFGRLIPPRDPQALRRALLDLAGTSRADRLAGQRRATELFGGEGFLDAHEEAFPVWSHRSIEQRERTDMSELRRVVAVCHQYPPWNLGGLAEYAERSLHRLHHDHADLRLTLFTMNCPDDFPRKALDADGVEIRRPGMPRGLKRRLLEPGNRSSLRGQGWFGLALLHFNLMVFLALLRSRPRHAVVAVHDWQSAPAGILAAGLLRLPTVHHVHNTELTMAAGSEIPDPFGLIGTLQRWMSRLGTLIIVPTPEMKALLIRHDWPADRIRVVPHGYEDRSPAPEAEAVEMARNPARRKLAATFGLPPEARILVFAGRLSRIKGIHLLLRGLPLIAERHPDIRLFVLGAGLAGTDLDAAVDHLVTGLRLQDRVHVYHRYLPHDQVQQHYLAADVCVFPSAYEPFGLVSVEAMSTGVPVVLGPGFSETIAYDGQHRAALRVTGDSPAELARMVVSLLDDPAAAAEIGRRGRKHVRQSFRWSTAVSATVTVYRQAMARRSGAEESG
jgi:glycogen synthase